MGEEISTSGQEREFVDVYELMAALAGDNYTRTIAIRYMRLLVMVSRSPYIAVEVKRAIGFVERVSMSLCNLKSEQMAELVDLVNKNRKAVDDGF